jgi:carboxylesterase type B
MYQGFSCPRLPSQAGTAPTPELLAFSNVTTVGLELFNLIANPPDAVYGEDCLSLNVWSKPQSGESHKAVMVFIHGGGFSGGTTSLSVFDGAPLVEKEDVIIVTIK